MLEGVFYAKIKKEPENRQEKFKEFFEKVEKIEH